MRLFFILCLCGILFPPLMSLSDNQPWIKGEGRLGQEAERYIIYAELSTNLPSGALIETTAYYAKKFPAPLAVEEETGQAYEIEKIPLSEGTGWVKETACTIKMGFFLGEPYPGEYIIEVRFNPWAQTQAVQTELPVDTKLIRQEISFSYGNEEDLAHRKKEVYKEIYKVIEGIKELYDDLLREVKDQQSLNKFDAGRWGKWVNPWMDTIKTIKQTNQARLKPRVYWLETAGKSYIKGLCNRLETLSQQYPKLVKTSEKAYEDFLESSAEFSMVLTGHLEQLGYGMIINKTRVQKIIKMFEKNYTMFKDVYHKTLEEITRPDLSEWIKLITPYRTQIEQQLFKLIKETPDHIFATYTIGLGQNIQSYINECTAAVSESGSPERKTLINQLEEKIDKDLKELYRVLELK